MTGLSVKMLTVHLDSRAAFQVINGVIDSRSYPSHASRSIIRRSWNSFQLRCVIVEGFRGQALGTQEMCAVNPNLQTPNVSEVLISCGGGDK